MSQIAIDGPSGAGKSTIAKEIAKARGFMHVDTGAMYRLIGLACIRAGVDLKDEEAVTEICKNADIDVRFEDGVQNNYLDGELVNNEIRREEVGMAASTTSAFAGVRERLVKMQQEVGEKYDVVMDGRDIGTHVLVNADLKVFLTATPECRADRRFKELQEKGQECVYEDILADIKQRDHNDSTRAISPLRKADDAIEVDSSDMNIQEVTDFILGLLG